MPHPAMPVVLALTGSPCEAAASTSALPSATPPPRPRLRPPPAHRLVLVRTITLASRNWVWAPAKTLTLSVPLHAADPSVPVLLRHRRRVISRSTPWSKQPSPSYHSTGQQQEEEAAAAEPGPAATGVSAGARAADIETDFIKRFEDMKNRLMLLPQNDLEIVSNDS